MFENYISETWDSELTRFVLDYINDHTFINIRSLRKLYYPNTIIYEHETRSISIKLGRIMKELKELGFVSNWSKKTFKNHYKGKLIQNLEKKNKNVFRKKA